MSKNKNSGGNATAKTKTQTNKKAIAFIVGVLLLAVAYVITSLSLGLGTGAPAWNPKDWGKAGSTADGGDPTPTARTLAISSDGSEIKNGCKYSMGRSAVNGITYLSETNNNQTYVPDGEIYVTAELANEYINGAFDYSVKFANENAEWAVGKVADYYVSVEAVAGNSSMAKLRYLAPFSEQIILTATLRGTDSSDSCTIDCVKVVTSFQLYYGSNDFDDGNSFDIDVGLGTGTVDGDFNFSSGSIKLKDDFISAFKSYLKFDVTVKIANFTAADVTDIGTYYAVCGDIRYSMFIEGFDNYDEAHKEAIYYAWYTAYESMNYNPNANGNLFVSADFNYCYNGVKVKLYADSDVFAGCNINGSCYGYGIAPNVQLNKNYVF